MLIFEFVVFCFAVFKSLQVYKLRQMTGNAPSIMAVLVRDSIFYFFGVMSVIMMNMFIWAVARVSLGLIH